jgi:hypothetical protein
MIMSYLLMRLVNLIVTMESFLVLHVFFHYGVSAS